MTQAANQAASPHRALTEDQEDRIIFDVLRLGGTSPEVRAWHLRPDAPIREAIRGELPRECMTWHERKAAAIGRAQPRV